MTKDIFENVEIEIVTSDNIITANDSYVLLPEHKFDGYNDSQRANGNYNK